MAGFHIDHAPSLGVLRLPDELLGEICVQVLRNNCEVHELERYSDTQSVTFYEWLRVTHICKR